ncbi:hypothetical protein VTK26DRAFT_1920 [Humicola hyalothermophila]
MAALSFPPASLDAVVALYSIIHLPREEQAALMGRVAAWLRPGGVVLANFGTEALEAFVDERWLGRGATGGAGDAAAGTGTGTGEEGEGGAGGRGGGSESGSGGWMYWSGWGREATVEMVRRAGSEGGGEGVLEVLVEEVSEGGRMDAEFVWVIARKKGGDGRETEVVG